MIFFFFFPKYYSSYFSSKSEKWGDQKATQSSWDEEKYRNSSTVPPSNGTCAFQQGIRDHFNSRVASLFPSPRAQNNGKDRGSSSQRHGWTDGWVRRIKKKSLELQSQTLLKESCLGNTETLISCVVPEQKTLLPQSTSLFKYQGQRPEALNIQRTYIFHFRCLCSTQMPEALHVHVSSLWLLQLLHDLASGPSNSITVSIIKVMSSYNYKTTRIHVQAVESLACTLEV